MTKWVINSFMDIRQLELFIAVAEELHFGKAAERLHMSQPPLSQQIRQMETSLGVKLFKRTTRSVELTPAGQSFLTQARLVIDAMTAAELAAKAMGTGIFGRVRLGFAGAATRHLLPKLAREVKSRYPNIDLVLIGNLYANAAQAALSRGEIDLGFVRLPFTLPGISYRAIEEETLMCVVPEDHELAKKKSVSLLDLADEPFVSFPRDSGSTLRVITNKVCWEYGFMPNVVQEAPDSYTIHAMVAAGQGVSIALSSTSTLNQPGVVYLPIVETMPRLQSAIAWNTKSDSAAVAAVVAVANEIFPKPAEELSEHERLLID
jgi:DNA-binding transcriptional LysR family regulator